MLRVLIRSALMLLRSAQNISLHGEIRINQYFLVEENAPCISEAYAMINF